MLVAKQVADLITLARALLGLGLAWLGLAQGAAGLPVAVSFMIAAWTADVFDGRIARRSRIQYSSWMGGHDLQIDMAVACGLLFYLLAAGFVNPYVAGIYIIIWTAYFVLRGLSRSLGMLFQAPVYGWFIWVAMQAMPAAGRWLLVWIVVVVIFTWPQFPRQVVPGFLAGIRRRSP